MSLSQSGGSRNPLAGDTASLVIDKPFLAMMYIDQDEGDDQSEEQAKADLNRSVSCESLCRRAAWNAKYLFERTRPREIHLSITEQVYDKDIQCERSAGEEDRSSVYAHRWNGYMGRLKR